MNAFDNSVLHKILNIIIKNLSDCLYKIRLWVYWCTVPFKVKKIRGKEKIKVLFVVTGICDWKCYFLFLKMSKHNRFVPIIGATVNPKYPESKNQLVSFLESRNIEYLNIDTLKGGIDSICPDIIIYDSPYTSGYNKGIAYDCNLDYLFCGCDYCLSITKHVVHLKHPWYDYCWQFYVEHSDVKKRKIEILGRRANNIRVTGIPLQDELMCPKDSYVDPWKDKTGKKRIIYAPHHSFKGSNGDGIEFATFLEYHQFMLDMAAKYRNQITITFKPHPFLYIKLLNIWGKEKTDSYYHQWETLPNTQFENGEYIGLFKYSDAIIHDCASFIVEYLYMDNPSLYLTAESNNTEDMFDFVKDCYSCYEHATNKDEIENFIINLILGYDNKRNKRRECIKKHLYPPLGNSASDNIINAILND